MQPHEVRFLVDNYYQLQDERITFNGQIRSVSDGGQNEPHEVLTWLAKNTRFLEDQLKAALHAWAKKQPTASWALSIHGIGPVIA
ncbi:hypothetical protein, partial [Staphylococcus pseudintermedius]|uniref:hypothetical protein n=1 Tax=Staphylococcus pseudintermedius TaxID=283734 RepID=UPI001EE75DD2